jgi:phospholipase A1
MYQFYVTVLIAFALVLLAPLAVAQMATKNCVMQQYAQGDESLTLAHIRNLCSPKILVEEKVEVASQSMTADSEPTPGAITHRILMERQTQFQPYVITPHRKNYILPIMTSTAINKEAYSSFDGYEDNLENIEAKLQISFKVPLNYDSMFVEDDALYFGFTTQAWWQIYADNISKPFRETNYQPEIFYIAPLDWHPFGGNTGILVGIEHQSNGRAQNLSRSWNRVYTNLLFEKNNFALTFRPWVRISEDQKAFPLDPEGDDNPDIEDFLGHYEFDMAYKWNRLEFTFNGRRNFATQNGSAEIGLSFPLWGKLLGFATAFSGYGESLIDYNYRQTRFGIGIALNNVL